ncbi:MAG: hypothetical protein ABSB61_04875 [Anaerolineales bacterium]|jgi:hypothetical protein
MPESLGTAVLELDADDSNLKGKLSGTGTATNALAGSLTELNAGIQIAERAMQTMGQVYDATVGKAVTLADNVRNLSREIGSSSEQSSRLIFASNEMGISTDQLTTSLKNAISKGYDPTVQGLMGMADKYNSLGTQIEKTKFLTETFGRGGLAMGQLLDLGSVGIENMSNKADALGAVLNDKDVVAARNFTLATGDLKAATDGLEISVGTGLIPTLTRAAMALTSLVTGNRTVLSALDDHKAHLLTLNMSYEDYCTEMKRAAGVAGDFVASNGDLVDPLTQETVRTGYLATTLHDYNAEMAIGVEKTDAQTHADDQLELVRAGLTAVTQDLARAEFNRDAALREAGQTSTMEITAFQGIQKTGEDAATSLDRYFVKGGAAWLAAAKQIDATTGTSIVQQYQYNKSITDATDAYIKHIRAGETLTQASKEYGDALSAINQQGFFPNADQEFAHVHDLFDSIPRDVTSYIHLITITGTGDPWAGAHGAHGAAEATGQHGLDMMVPPGYPGDTFPVLASSGERVVIQTPAQQAGAGGRGRGKGVMEGATVNINNGFDANKMITTLRTL